MWTIIKISHARRTVASVLAGLSALSVAFAVETPAPIMASNDVSAALNLECGQTLDDLHGTQDSVRLFALDVPPGRSRLVFTMGGGIGDADLYVRHALPPALHAYDCRPYVLGNDEEVEVRDPAAGVWYVMLRGFTGYTGAWFSVACFAPPTAAGDEQQSLPYRDMELALYYELFGMSGRPKAWTVELRAQALRQEGWAAYSAGDYNGAISAWQKWRDLDGSDAEPVSLIGDVYLRAGDVDNAMAYYRQSLDVYPGQIDLAARFARLLDTIADQPAAARDLLNFYARIFPSNPAVTLAQAAWLMRRHRYVEARTLVQNVIAACPPEFATERLQALSLLHGLLLTKRERFVNFRTILEIGRRPGMAANLAWSMREHNLLTYPESWMLMEFLARMADNETEPEKRDIYAGLLPRRTVAVEDFSLNRMSRDWIASKDENLNEDGRLVLSADMTQTEAALRLIGSDGMPNGFVDITIESTRGFFWIYARRGANNMLRFGWDEDGRLYLQLWINGQLVENQLRFWSRQSGVTSLRLELRGDGAFGFIDGALAFSAPLAIPLDMGLGWWGFAPWSQHPGLAQVVVRQLRGGPLPVMVGVLKVSGNDDNAVVMDAKISQLKSRMHELSALAPDWYTQRDDGVVDGQSPRARMDLRLLCRYYRVRLLPVVNVRDPRQLDFVRLISLAYADRLDGFTLLVEKMPPTDWFAATEELLLDTDLTVHVLLLDDVAKRAQIREICPHVGLFPGPRRTHLLPVLSGTSLPAAADGKPIEDAALSAVLLL